MTTLRTSVKRSMKDKLRITSPAEIGRLQSVIHIWTACQKQMPFQFAVCDQRLPPPSSEDALAAVKNPPLLLLSATLSSKHLCFLAMRCGGANDSIYYRLHNKYVSLITSGLLTGLCFAPPYLSLFLRETQAPCLKTIYTNHALRLSANAGNFSHLF